MKHKRTNERPITWVDHLQGLVIALLIYGAALLDAMKL